MQKHLGKCGRAATLVLASLLAILLPVGGWPQQTANNDIGDGGNSMGFDMAPGPVQPTWKSLSKATGCRIGLSVRSS